MHARHHAPVFLSAVSVGIIALASLWSLVTPAHAALPKSPAPQEDELEAAGAVAYPAAAGVMAGRNPAPVPLDERQKRLLYEYKKAGMDYHNNRMEAEARTAETPSTTGYDAHMLALKSAAAAEVGALSRYRFQRRSAQLGDWERFVVTVLP
jgi:hypothetical protein